MQERNTEEHGIPKSKVSEPIWPAGHCETPVSSHLKVTLCCDAYPLVKIMYSLLVVTVKPSPFVALNMASRAR